MQHDKLDQRLRQLAGEIASVATEPPAFLSDTVTENAGPAKAHRRLRPLLTAAACTIFVVLGVVWLWPGTRSPQIVEVTDVAAQPTTVGDGGPAVTQAPTPEPTVALAPLFLLPDQRRWVVVEDWDDRSPSNSAALQLDVAPLDDAGVPQLGWRIILRYETGRVEDFDQQWGDTSAIGEPIELDIANGRGRVVTNVQVPLGAAQIWVGGTFVYMQTDDPDADLASLAMSLQPVDEQTWFAARAGAEGQRRFAVEAAMANIEPIALIDEPMPHWVLPEPWEPEWVTDMTIWTAEQHAQSAALAELTRPIAEAAPPTSYGQWYFGFGETQEQAAAQFVPQVAISSFILAEGSSTTHPVNYESIEALGLSGVVSPTAGSTWVELGVGNVRVTVTAPSLDRQHVLDFLDTLEFASPDPLDGFISNDPRFAPITLSSAEGDPPSWHASWTHPDRGNAVTSVSRMSPTELRSWLFNYQLADVPTRIWEAIAEDSVIDLGPGTTYDPTTGLLTSLAGIELDDLIPIALDDWIALVTPINTDPLNPR